MNGDQGDNSLSFAGAAYAFVRSGTNWSQQAYLKASNTGASDFFSHSVAVWENTVVVGAYGEDVGGWDSGAVYVFERHQGGTDQWGQVQKLTASDAEDRDVFGDAVTISWDTVVVDDLTCGTNEPGVFAGGDAVRGPASVVEAMADGKRAARAIDNFLNGKPLDENLQPPARPPEPMTEEERLTLRIDTEAEARIEMPELDAKERSGNFDEVELGYTAEMAMAEAARCLNCGVCSECHQCETACDVNAIDLEMTAEEVDVDAGAILVAVGFNGQGLCRRVSL